MNRQLIRLFLGCIALAALLAACSTAKIEARLEANPRCKDVTNPKTGALMPCPDSDKAFYRSVGLAPSQPSSVTSVTATDPAIIQSQTSSDTTNSKSLGSQTKVIPLQNDCKPQIHKKKGGVLPCPALD
jgi:hypothetical protein